MQRTAQREPNGARPRQSSRPDRPLRPEQRRTSPPGITQTRPATPTTPLASTGAARIVQERHVFDDPQLHRPFLTTKGTPLLLVRPAPELEPPAQEVRRPLRLVPKPPSVHQPPTSRPARPLPDPVDPAALGRCPAGVATGVGGAGRSAQPTAAAPPVATEPGGHGDHPGAPVGAWFLHPRPAAAGTRATGHSPGGRGLRDRGPGAPGARRGGPPGTRCAWLEVHCPAAGLSAGYFFRLGGLTPLAWVRAAARRSRRGTVAPPAPSRAGPPFGPAPFDTAVPPSSSGPE